MRGYKVSLVDMLPELVFDDLNHVKRELNKAMSSDDSDHRSNRVVELKNLLEEIFINEIPHDITNIAGEQWEAMLDAIETYSQYPEYNEAKKVLSKVKDFEEAITQYNIDIEAQATDGDTMKAFEDNIGIPERLYKELAGIGLTIGDFAGNGVDDDSWGELLNLINDDYYGELKMFKGDILKNLDNAMSEMENLSEGEGNPSKLQGYWESLLDAIELHNNNLRVMPPNGGSIGKSTLIASAFQAGLRAGYRAYQNRR